MGTSCVVLFLLTFRGAEGDAQICPWCYIGEKEMENALEAVRDLPITIKIEHRPYQLQPSLPEDEALVKREWYINRFGKEKFASMMEMLTQRAKQMGLTM